MNLPLLAAVSASVVAAAAWRLGALSISGAVAAAVVGGVCLGGGGWLGATALLAFFVTSTALSRLGRRRKERLGYAKGDRRDAAQVLANGGVAAVAGLLAGWLPQEDPRPVAALLGALAAANADTWATEIGSLAGGTPRRITDGKRAEVGESGAVSLPGTLAAWAGAALVGTVALPFGKGAGLAVAATLGGFAGALLDSALGATVQAQYRCAVCGRKTERPIHCRSATRLESGWRWLENDLVNLAATVGGALLTLWIAGRS